jgi:hypothetical protein
MNQNEQIVETAVEMIQTAVKTPNISLDPHDLRQWFCVELEKKGISASAAGYNPIQINN